MTPSEHELSSGQSIRADVRAIEPFARDLTVFFDRIAGEGLFRRPPPKDLPAVAERRLHEGRYLLRPCGCEFREEIVGAAVLELLDVLDRHLPERRAALALLRDVFVTAKVEPAAFLGSVFRNRGNEVIQFVRQLELEDDLVAFFAVCLARPFRRQVAQALLEGVDVGGWRCGYCPVCGHWPGLGHLHSEDGRLTLWCLHCATPWTFKRLQCPFCLTEDQASLALMTPESDESYRLHACTSCRRYLKEVRSEAIAKEFPFLQVALGTIRLDYVALQDGYIRESPLTVRYEDPDGNELLLYRQAAGAIDAGPNPDPCAV